MHPYSVHRFPPIRFSPLRFVSIKTDTSSRWSKSDSVFIRSCSFSICSRSNLPKSVPLFSHVFFCFPFLFTNFLSSLANPIKSFSDFSPIQIYVGSCCVAYGIVFTTEWVKTWLRIRPKRTIADLRLLISNRCFTALPFSLDFVCFSKPFAGEPANALAFARDVWSVMDRTIERELHCRKRVSFTRFLWPCFSIRTWNDKVEIWTWELLEIIRN